MERPGMEHISIALSSLVQDLIEREQDRGQLERASHVEEIALASSWFQPEAIEAA